MIIESFFAATKIFLRNQIDRCKTNKLLIFTKSPISSKPLPTISQKEVSNYAHGTGEDAPIRLFQGNASKAASLRGRFFMGNSY
jgi:hypothetical protein